MATRDAEATAKNAEASTSNGVGMCLQWSRERANIPALQPDAATAWKHAVHRHVGDRNPPRGAMCYWTGGSKGYGHIAVSLGGGMIRSSDSGGAGRPATVPLRWVEDNWRMPYAGWADNVNDRVIPGVGASDDGGDDVPDLLNLNSDDMRASGDWQGVTWENIGGNAADRASVGNPGVNLGGRRVVYTFAALVEGANQGQVRTRLAVGTGRGDAWTVNRTSLAAGHGVRAVDTRAEAIGADGWVRFQIMAPKGLTISRVMCRVLIW